MGAPEGRLIAVEKRTLDISTQARPQTQSTFARNCIQPIGTYALALPATPISAFAWPKRYA